VFDRAQASAFAAVNADRPSSWPMIHAGDRFAQ
jgi:hypothetical protein